MKRNMWRSREEHEIEHKYEIRKITTASNKNKSWYVGRTKGKSAQLSSVGVLGSAEKMYMYVVVGACVCAVWVWKACYDQRENKQVGKVWRHVVCFIIIIIFSLYIRVLHFPTCVQQ